MAQDSAMHQGETVGHAASTDIWAAPYTADEYADIYSKILASNLAVGYVVPGYGNNLKISANSPAAMNVIVKSGAAFFRGRIYENTADVTLTITAADGSNPRIDRIVLRHDVAAQTITLAVLAGTPAATPSLPALTQNATTYELEIAYVWVAALAASISDAEVHDMRQFMITPELMYKSLSQQNLIINSEFMAFSANQKPDAWTLASTATWASATKPAAMSRGRAVQITATAANAGMTQQFPVKASTLYSFRVLLNVTAGDVGRIQITTNSASPDTITRSVRRTGSFIEETIYYTTESDASLMTVSLLATNNTDVVQYGQALLIEGYTPGPFREFRELIMFDNTINTTGWILGNSLSSGNTTFDLSTAYSGRILRGTRAVVLTIEGNDSGSAASTNTRIQVQVDTGANAIWGTARVDGLPNDRVRSHQVVAALRGSNNLQFVISIDASGAGTFDAAVRAQGIYI